MCTVLSGKAELIKRDMHSEQRGNYESGCVYIFYYLFTLEVYILYFIILGFLLSEWDCKFYSHISPKPTSKYWINYFIQIEI